MLLLLETAVSGIFEQAEKRSFKEQGLPCLALEVQRTSADLQWKRNMGWLLPRSQEESCWSVGLCGTWLNVPPVQSLTQMSLRYW